MKTALLSLCLLATSSSFAAQVFRGTSISVASPFISTQTTMTSDLVRKKEAVTILNDAQEAIQSGKMSSLLSKKVGEVFEANQEISLSEALEIVIESAEQVLE